MSFTDGYFTAKLRDLPKVTHWTSGISRKKNLWGHVLIKNPCWFVFFPPHLSQLFYFNFTIVCRFNWYKEDPDYKKFTQSAYFMFYSTLGVQTIEIGLFGPSVSTGAMHIPCVSSWSHIKGINGSPGLTTIQFLLMTLAVRWSSSVSGLCNIFQSPFLNIYIC